nr:DUF4275 family protein [Planococcus glaciei]
MRFQSELKYKELPKWGKYLRGRWEEHFASHLSPKKKKRNLSEELPLASLQL